MCWVTKCLLHIVTEWRTWSHSANSIAVWSAATQHNGARGAGVGNVSRVVGEATARAKSPRVTSGVWPFAARGLH